MSGRSRALKYIARVDNFDEEEYEGVFLQRANKKIDPGVNAVTPTFIRNENDAAAFAPKDIIFKLAVPVVVGGSARKSCQF